MSRFDRVIAVDWSARSTPSPRRPSADAIWIADVSQGKAEHVYCRTRDDAERLLTNALEDAVASGQRVLAGFDFPFGYPEGFAELLTGETHPLGVWSWLTSHIRDRTDNANNRFEIAAMVNRRVAGNSPFWGRPNTFDCAYLPARAAERARNPLAERREVERLVRTAQSVWKLYTTGSVGSQALLGIPRLQRLRKVFAGKISVWPFERRDRPIVFAEIYPSLLSEQVARVCQADPAAIKDAVQVQILSHALFRLSENAGIDKLFAAAPCDTARTEGWILGAGAEDTLRKAA